MNVFKTLSDLSWTARIAKGRAERAGRKIKRADQQLKRVKGGKSDKSDKSEPQRRSGSAPQPTSASQAQPQPSPGLQPRSTSGSASQPTSGVEPDKDTKPGVLVPVVAGVVGAIGAAPLSLFVADNSDDRLVLALIGLPLGAILTVGVVFAYRSAGLIDR